MFDKKGNIPELVNYIKKNLKKGYTKESLRWALLNQGYSKMEVERSIRRADQDLARKAPIIKEKPVIRYEVVEPKDFKLNKEEKRPFWKRLFGG